ncbi:sulfate ABC transporter permease subunit CysW [Segnochrobactraceae bacterium EtOH-i3]
MRGRRIGDGAVARRMILGFVLVLSLLVLVAPIAVILVHAFSAGIPTFLSELARPDTVKAMQLTVIVALIVVPVNTVFGLVAAWALGKFRFPGRRFLIALMEVPFSVSPVVAGVAYLFVYGARGLFGEFLSDHDIKIMFALPGIVLASLFVTAPLVAREVLSLMESQGNDTEEAALSLGASGLTTFFRVTLPNIRWALIFGVVLCNARVMGEFGAVSVVSGNIRGETNTLPLQIELLYHDYNAVGAFAAASVLTGLALVTLVVKYLIDRAGKAAGVELSARTGH